MTTVDAHAARPSTASPPLAFPTTGDASGRTFGAEELAAVTRVLESGRLCRTVGTEAGALEREFADYLGVGETVASTSGTAALHLAVAAVNPEPGDEIVVPPITDYGTVAGVLAQCAIPVFADVDPLTGCMTPESFLAVVTPRTRAVIVVHLFGGSARIDEIVALAHERGIVVIEDCAQAYLARPDAIGGPVGTHGDIGCFSLQQSKHISAGDGGLTVTNDPAYARRMRLFADKGWPRDTGERTHLFPGLNYRMTELQAAVTRAQLPKLAGVIAARRRTAGSAISALTGLPGLRLPQHPDRHSFWMLPLVLDRQQIHLGCRKFAAVLIEHGVPAAGGYLTTPLNQTPAMTGRQVFGTSHFPFTVADDRPTRYRSGECPVADSLVADSLVVIAWNENYRGEHVDRVVNAVIDAHRRATS